MGFLISNQDTTPAARVKFLIVFFDHSGLPTKAGFMNIG